MVQLSSELGIARLRFDIGGLIAVHRIHDGRKIQSLRIGARESGVAVRTPLHRGAHAIAVADEEIVAHADFIAVVEDRRTGHRQQQAVHQLDAVQIVFHQRRQAAADAEIDARLQIRRVRGVHVVAFLAGHHLQGQLIVIAQKNRPLAAIRNVRRLLHDFDDGIAVLLRDGHVDARHQRKVIRHVAFIAVAEVLAHVLRPLIGLGQQKAVLVVRVDGGAQLLDDRVGFAQIFVVGPFALDQVGNGIEPEAVDAHVEPEPHDLQHRFHDLRIVEIQIRLMAEEAVPVVGLRDAGPRSSSRFRCR